jgi:hypothetical protein
MRKQASGMSNEPNRAGATRADKRLRIAKSWRDLGTQN